MIIQRVKVAPSVLIAIAISVVHLAAAAVALACELEVVRWAFTELGVLAP